MKVDQNEAGDAKAESSRKSSCVICCCRKNTKEGKLPLSSLKSDRYEYVVEKLAIKKVPLSLFATEDDFVDYDALSSSTYFKRLQKTVDEPDKKSHVTFASFYPSRPSSVRTRPTLYSMKENVHEEGLHVKSKEHTKQEDHHHEGHKHNDMMSQLLTNFSMMYGGRVGFPQMKLKEQPKKKSPFSTPVRVPSPERQPEIKSHLFQKPNVAMARNFQQQIQAQVHTAVPMYPNDLSYKMPQDIKNTIDILGAARPQTFYKDPNPKFQKTIYHPDVPRHLPEKETIELIEEESRELRCIPLDKDVKLVLHKCQCNGDQPTEFIQNPSIIRKTGPPNMTMPSCKPPLVHTFQNKTIPKKVTTTTNKVIAFFEENKYETMPIVLEKEHNVAVLPSNFSSKEASTFTEVIETRESNEIENSASSNLATVIKEEPEEEPITDVKNVKGHNLKWKIIIKHHDEDEAN